MQAVLSEQEFRQLQGMISSVAGISVSKEKMAPITGRLHKPPHHNRLESNGAYFDLQKSPSELQVAVDLLTTDEACSCREPAHVDFRRRTVLPPLARVPRAVRVWSGASPSGE